MDYFTYIIQSEKDGTFYIGSSEDPKRRLEKHNSPHKGYTSRKQPWRLAYTEIYQTKTEALKRENFLKKQKSKDFIFRLISGSPAG